MNRNRASWLWAAMAAVLVVVFDGHAQLAGWPRRARIYIKTSSAGLTGNVNNFPVLVRLTKAAFPMDEAKAGGADLRFTSSDSTTILPHEIERWDAAGGRAEIWVKLNVVRANDDNQFIMIHWSNPGAASTSSPNLVFGTAAADGGFAAVFHLSEGQGLYKDATVNANSGTASWGTRVNRPECVIGPGVTLMSPDRIRVLNNATLNPTGDLTLSAWVRETGASQGHYVTKYQWGLTPPAISYKLASAPWNTEVMFTVAADPAIERDVRAPFSATGVWAHVTGVYSASAGKIMMYKNGVKTAEVAHTEGIRPTTTDVLIGAQSDPYGPSNYANGDVDEVRIATAAHSDDWIRLSYHTQRENQTVVVPNVDTSAARITADPRSQTVLAGSDATFSVTAGGQEPLRYTWQKNGTGSAGTSAVLTLNKVNGSDNNDIYRCIVSNGIGADTSAPCTLRVVTQPTASFTVAPVSGQVPLTVILNDNSTGSISSWKVLWGDGKSETFTSSPKNKTHIYGVAGTYLCTLIVTGPSPTIPDTARSAAITVMPPPTANPLRLDAAEVSATSISLTFFGIRNIETNPLLPNYADSIGLWFSRTGFGSTTIRNDTARAGVWKVFSTAQVKQAAGADSVYRTTVTVAPPLTPAEVLFGFWASPFWGNGKLAPFDWSDTAAVAMNPVNRLTVRGQFLGNADPQSVALDTLRLDSALVRIENAAAIDTAAISSISLRYGLGDATPREAALVPTTEYLAGISGGSYSWRFRDPQFFGDTQRVSVAIYLIGKNNLTSTPATATFLVGWPRPANPCTLRVAEVRSTRIDLAWNAVTGVDSIRVLYSRSPIPPGTIDMAQGTGFEVLPGTATSYRAGGLQSQTRYHLAIQVLDNRLWSPVTLAAGKSDSTPSVSTGDAVTNSTAIDSVWFDATRNTFNIQWQCDLISGVDLELGITFDPNRSKVTTVAPAAPDWGKVIPVNQASGTAAIDGGTSIVFDTQYYVALWLRTADGQWAAPDPATCTCIDSVKIPSPTLQVIRYFTPDRRPDTVKAFNDQVWIWCDSRYRLNSYVTDTLRVHSPAVLPQETAPVSVGFSFANVPHPAFFVGVHYDPALIPAGFGHEDIALFRDSSGVLLAAHGFVIDSTRNLVWIYAADLGTNQNPHPFIALVDLKRPGITVTSDTASAVDPELGSPTDTISISDNIQNIEWQLLVGKDGDPFAIGSEGFTASGALNVKFPANAVTADNGVRALLIVSDGAHRDTVDLSRRARRSRSDVMNTAEMEYVPLTATAVIDSPDAVHALRALASDGKPWSYDPQTFRLMRWVQSSGGTVDDRWLEYSSLVAGQFLFAPGTVIWLKTRTSRVIDFGSGTTVTQKRPFEIVLPGGEWSHFSVPYRYDIMMGDILQTTGGTVDQVEFYRWAVQDADDIAYQGKKWYVSTPLYIKELLDASSPDSLVSGGELSAFAAFNMAGQAIRLRIPALPVSMSRYAMSRTRRATAAWNVRVDASTKDGPVSPVYCAFYPGGGDVRYSARPPSFHTVTAGVHDRRTSTIHGHAIHHGPENGGFAYELAFRNSGTARQEVTYRLDRLETLPLGLSPAIYDPLSREWEGVEGDHRVTLSAGETGFRWLVIGDGQYRGGFANGIPGSSLRLLGCTPNPFRSQATIRYSLPYSGIGSVRFSLCDMWGRTVWQQDLRPSGTGEHTVVWDGRNAHGLRAPAGIYVLRMSAFTENGKPAGSFKTRVTRLP